MDNEPKRGGPTALILAHAVCCGGIVLVATGALSGMGAWLLEGGLTWLLAAAVLTAASLFLWRRRTGGATGNVAAHHPRATDLPNQTVKRPRINPADGGK